MKRNYRKKLIRRGLPVILAVGAVLIIVIAILVKSPKLEQKEIVDTSIDAASAHDEGQTDSTTPTVPLYDASSTEDITYIKPGIVFEDNNVKIETISYVENLIYGKGIIMRYTNKTKESIRISLSECTINGSTVDVLYEKDVPSITTDTFYYDVDDLTGRLQTCSLVYTISKGTEQYSTDKVAIK